MALLVLTDRDLSFKIRLFQIVLKDSESSVFGMIKQTYVHIFPIVAHCGLIYGRKCFVIWSEKKNEFCRKWCWLFPNIKARYLNVEVNYISEYQNIFLVPNSERKYQNRKWRILFFVLKKPNWNYVDINHVYHQIPWF